MAVTNVRDFQAAQRGDTDGVGDAFEGMALDIEPGAAFGLIQGQIRQWVEDHGRWATDEEVRHEAARLYDAAHQCDGIENITVSATVDGVAFEPVTVTPGQFAAVVDQAASGELPGMRQRPEPTVRGVLRVPSDQEFDEGADFLDSGALKARAAILIDRHPDLFGHLDGTAGISVGYAWKRAGGKKLGNAVFAKCIKPTGLLKHFSGYTFVIWLAADHCRAAYYGDAEIEQTLFHEMLHTGLAEVDEDTGRGGGPAMVPHQLEIFHAEIEVYGFDAVILREAAPLLRQAVYTAKAPTSCAGCSMDVELTPGGYCKFCDPAAVAAHHAAKSREQMPPEGVICHPDGTPMTADEIAELEAADYRDDQAPEEDESDG